MKNTPDFSGYATKANLKCTDGRTILPDAFKHQDGMIVPLVWQHMHDAPGNVLGHAVLENREDGVYVRGYFNKSADAQKAKELVQHLDIDSLSIYANGLIEKAKRVIHGVIREVSLVLSGANPGAKIDFVAIEHADGSMTDLDDEAVIYTGLKLEHSEDPEDLDEDDEEPIEHADGEDETVNDVFETLSEKQKTAVYAIVGALLEDPSTGMKQSGIDNNDESSNEGENKIMKHNVFDGQEGIRNRKSVLSHSDIDTILKNAKRDGSIKRAFLEHVGTLDEETQELITYETNYIAHAGTYGVGSDRDNLELLFPDAINVTNEPTFIAREMSWVKKVLNATKHLPFSRIKSLHADITADEARAKGYVTGAEKAEEVFPVLKRVTTPTTIYKKQKLDRDDIVDITDFSIVVWLKREMRFMLDEEIARAILVSDGRLNTDADWINTDNVRPVWGDSTVYVHYEQVASTLTTVELIDKFVEMSLEYRGTGMPVAYMAPSFRVAMMLLRDSDGRRMYRSKAELADELGVADIIDVPVMEGLSRTPDTTEYELRAIVVNLSDYSVGADKGGEVNLFDDFDIDFNQQKYLIETRISGALTIPKSALVLEQEVAA